jgi:archaellum component FlaC
MGYDHNNWYWSDYSLELALLQTIPHNLYDHIQERINKFTYKQDGGKDACIDFASTLNELGTERTGLKLFVFK